MPLFSGLRSFNEPEDLCSGFLRSEKSIDLSRVWTREPWISRRARYPETTEADFRCLTGIGFRKSVRWLVGYTFSCSLLLQLWISESISVLVVFFFYRLLNFIPCCTVPSVLLHYGNVSPWWSEGANPSDLIFHSTCSPYLCFAFCPLVVNYPSFHFGIKSH